MLRAKACIVFSVGLEEEVSPILAQLSGKGYDVCVAAAEQQVVAAAQGGSTQIPDEVKNCIINAEICVFLIPKQNTACVTNAGSYAGGLGKRIVAVIEDVGSLPQIFDDLATSVVVLDSPKLSAALQGELVWEVPSASGDGKRNIHRVKCQ